jgi:hypothetical protein
VGVVIGPTRAFPHSLRAFLPNSGAHPFPASYGEVSSRALLASKISRTQNQWDYLEVLFAALSTWGAPSMIVSDGGAIFYCNQAMDTYSALGIRKERIEPRQAWQNLVESHFNIARKMADARFARARSWEEVLAIHRRFVHDYNLQRHWAHESREDGRHSPVAVLDGHTGTMYPPTVLDRVLFAIRYTRHLDKHGFLRFQHWKLYGERGLAKAPVTVWVYDGSRHRSSTRPGCLRSTASNFERIASTCKR